MKHALVLQALLAISWHLSDVAFAQEACVCVEEVPAGRGLLSPVTISNAGDGSGRLFIGEQIGIVWIITAAGAKLPQPFLNITDLVFLNEGQRQTEQGFLSMRFHPNFVTNRKLYVYYTFRLPDTTVHTRISELQTLVSDPNMVDLTTLRTVLSFQQPYNNHNGGQLIFDESGYLLLATGDGGSGGDPDDNAQDLSNVLGKVLRIDIDVGTGDGEYGIPADNPFVGMPGVREEIYVHGLRNPWRMDMDVGDPNTGAGRGRYFIGDVGQNAWEEIDLMTAANAGANYGWAAYEGDACYKPALCDSINPDNLLFPIHAYSHAAVGRCIIGGNVHRGPQNPGLNGLYFYGDWTNGKMFYLEEDGAGGWVPHQYSTCAGNDCTTTCGTCTAPAFNTYNTAFINSYGTDENNEMYFVATDNPVPNHPGGALWRLVDGAPPKRH